VAFENINWFAPVEAQNQRNMMLQQAIGQGIANYQNQKKLEMERRQMEMGGSKAADFEQMAQNAVYKSALGMPMTPEDQAAINVMASTKSDQQYVNPDGSIVFRPNPYKTLLGAGMQRAGAEMPQVMRGEALPPLPMDTSQGYVNDLPEMANASDVYQNLTGEQMPPDLISQMGQSRSDAYTTQKDVANVSPFLTQSVYAEGSPKWKEEQSRIAEEKRAFEQKKAEQGLSLEKEKEVIDYENEYKKAESLLKTETGSKRIRLLVSRMKDINEELKNKGAIASSTNNMLENLKAYAGSSALGQQSRLINNPEIAALVKEYESLRNTAMPFFAAASEMGAKSMDSNTERLGILSGFGDPTGVYETNKNQLNNMDKLFGGGGDKTEKPQNSKPALTPEQAREILRQRGKL